MLFVCCYYFIGKKTKAQTWLVAKVMLLLQQSLKHWESPLNLCSPASHRCSAFFPWGLLSLGCRHSRHFKALGHWLVWSECSGISSFNDMSSLKAKLGQNHKLGQTCPSWLTAPAEWCFGDNSSRRFAVSNICFECGRSLGFKCMCSRWTFVLLETVFLSLLLNSSFHD